MTALSTRHAVEDLKADGKYFEAGQLSKANGETVAHFGCHYGLRATRDAAIEQFYAGFNYIAPSKPTKETTVTAIVKPKIELRKLKHSKSLSEETPAYTAQIWVDGRHFCDVSNNGTGGSDHQHSLKGVTNNDFQPALEALEARIRATFPASDISYMYGEPKGSKFLDESLETICHDLIWKQGVALTLKRKLAGAILFTKKGVEGGVFAASLKGILPSRHAATIVRFKERKADEIGVVLNDLPFDEALDLYFNIHSEG